MRHLLPFLWICVFETQSPYRETPDNSWWDFFVCLKVETHPPGQHQRNNGPGGGHAASFGGTTVGSACSGVELPCGFAQWWLNHKNTGTEGCAPQGLWDSATFSGSTAALSKWRCRSRSEDSKALEGQAAQGGAAGVAGGGWGGGMRVRPRRQGLGIWGQIAGGITENRLVFLWLEPAWYQADTFRRLNVRVIPESRSNN